MMGWCPIDGEECHHDGYCDDCEIGYEAKATETNKLKPCPFCGDTFIRIRMRKDGYSIGCNSLGCVCLHTVSKRFKTEKDAMEAWNKRT